MSNVVRMKKYNETLMVMPIRDTEPDLDAQIMKGNMFVAFTKKDNKLHFEYPQHLNLTEESLSQVKLEPLAIESFIAEGFTLNDVFSVAPIFGNMTPPDLIKTKEMLTEFTTVVMNATDGRMATYLVNAPLEGEEVYLAILDYKIKVDLVEDKTKMDSEHATYVVTLDYDNLDMDIALQSISKLKTVDGKVTIPEINGVPQSVEFPESGTIESIVLEDEPEELQDLLDSALKLYYGSANTDINRKLVDFYFIYVIAKEAGMELVSQRNSL